MFRCILLSAFVLTLSGCATQVELNTKIPILSERSKLIDNRTEDKKAFRHDSLFSVIGFFGDDKFSPRALDIFVADIRSEISPHEPLEIEVDEFRIGDFYPVRLGAGGVGLLGAIIFQTLIDINTDWSSVKSMKLDPAKDAVVCLFFGKINGIPIKVTTNEPYKVSVFAGIVYNDVNFQDALRTAVKRAAIDSIAQAQASK